VAPCSIEVPCCKSKSGNIFWGVYSLLGAQAAIIKITIKTMDTVVNTPNGSNGGSGGWAVAVIVLIVVLLVAIFVWPGMGNRGAQDNAGKDNSLNIDVNLPAGPGDEGGGDASAQ
jgi:hypothetical protein